MHAKDSLAVKISKLVKLCLANLPKYLVESYFSYPPPPMLLLCLSVDACAQLRKKRNFETEMKPSSKKQTGLLGPSSPFKKRRSAWWWLTLQKWHVNSVNCLLLWSKIERIIHLDNKHEHGDFRPNRFDLDFDLDHGACFRADFETAATRSPHIIPSLECIQLGCV